MRFLNSVFVILFCAVVFSVGFSLPVSAQQSGGHAGIAIVVNEDAVSMDDLNDRLNLIMTSSGLPNNEDTRQKILPQIIGSLVEEQLKLQEADRIEIQVSQGEINEGLRTIAQQNNLELEQFKEMLSKGGLSIETMERQIRAEIAWGKVIQARMRSKVVISEGDVDSVLDRLEKNVGKTEYLASEILLAVDENAGESEVSALAQNLVQQMRSGQAPFFRVAQQFSKAPGAPQGGDLGWVQDDQLPPELGAAIEDLEKGQISEPVRTLSGWHIMMVRDKRVIDEDNIPGRDQIRQSLGTQRLDRMQRRHLLDLKSAAFIENRLGS